jgi:hypothetical protein
MIGALGDSGIRRKWRPDFEELIEDCDVTVPVANSHCHRVIDATR